MAAIFRKPGQETWWVTYYVNGLRVRHSLRTREERIARLKLKKLEGDLVTGELVQASRTPLVSFLTAFCEHLSTIRTRKSFKNDLSYLRTVFGPVCDALRPGTTVNHRHRPKKPVTVEDRFAGRHIQVKVLEELTAGTIESHITRRVKQEGIAPKTANRIREVLHVLFSYAIRQHGFRSADRRFPNPVDAVPGARRRSGRFGS